MKGSSSPLDSGTAQPSLAHAADELCARCSRQLAGRTTFVLGGERRCWRCAIRYRPVLRRSLITAIVVGTLLVAINQGTVLIAGRFPAELFWKIPLTYCVPFCVATWGALSNSRE